MNIYESWNYDRLSDKQAEQYEVTYTGDFGLNSFRDKFSVKCMICGELLHENTTNPSAYIEIHEKACKNET